MFYKYDKLISYNALFNFVIGERGVGKSFGAKVFCINDFINKGNEFVYVRRYKEELSTAVGTFFNDVQNAGFFEDYVLTVKKQNKMDVFKCNGETCGYGVALSTSAILKSTSFPKVKTIIFDEFIIDTGAYRYLPNEVTKFLDLVETIGRTRDVRVLFLGNAITISNVYFNYFDLTLPYNSEFKTFKDGLIVVNYIKNPEYRAMKRQTRFGKLIDGTDYGNYAIDNEMLRDNDSFIERKTNNPRFWCTLVINGKKYGVYHDSYTGKTYISNDHEPNTQFVFALNIDDHNELNKFVNFRNNSFVKVLIENYKNGCLYFEDMKIKNTFLFVIKRCLSY